MSISKETVFGDYEKKVVNGKQNPKYVDLLEEDKPIAGQKFVCISFVSPEKILKQKELFFFEEFLKSWELSKGMDKFVQFLNFVSYKYNVNFDDMSNDFKDFVKEENDVIRISSMDGDYKTYVDQHEEKLENAFNVKHKFQTSTRGLKVRGIYPTQEEAELRCKLLRELDPNHDVFVGPVGLWMPWDPDAYKTGKVEYMEDELNQLMSEKDKNESFAKQAFDSRVKETKKKAIQDNIEKAQKSGSTLTQTIDDEGNLVSVNNMNTQQRNLEKKEDVSVSDIKDELFEGADIVIPDYAKKNK